MLRALLIYKMCLPLLNLPYIYSQTILELRYKNNEKYDCAWQTASSFPQSSEFVLPVKSATNTCHTGEICESMLYVVMYLDTDHRLSWDHVWYHAVDYPSQLCCDSIIRGGGSRGWEQMWRCWGSTSTWTGSTCFCCKTALRYAKVCPCKFTKILPNKVADYYVRDKYQLFI